MIMINKWQMGLIYSFEFPITLSNLLAFVYCLENGGSWRKHLLRVLCQRMRAMPHKLKLKAHILYFENVFFSSNTNRNSNQKMDGLNERIWALKKASGQQWMHLLEYLFNMTPCIFVCSALCNTQTFECRIQLLILYATDQNEWKSLITGIDIVTYLLKK